MGEPLSTTPDPAPQTFELSAAERNEMVAVAAYYLAERRGFASGGEEADWLLAERQIDHLLTRARAAGVGREALARLGLRNALQLWGE
jgi:hypothetical protein